MEQQMVRISVQVRSTAARFRVGIQALRVREAPALAGDRYPRGEVGVVFPAELEGYFAGKPAATSGATGHEQAHAAAA